MSGLGYITLTERDHVRQGLEDMLDAAIGDHGYRLFMVELPLALLVVEAAKRAEDRVEWFPQGKWATVQSMENATEREMQKMFDVRVPF